MRELYLTVDILKHQLLHKDTRAVPHCRHPQTQLVMRELYLIVDILKHQLLHKDTRAVPHCSHPQTPVAT
jgi:hypothetical protein